MMIATIMMVMVNPIECGEMMTDVLVGNCTGSPTPDDWYPELGSGAHSPKRVEQFKAKVMATIELCNTCPIKEQCLEQGMEKENLPFGIWGGKLAGQRLAMAGYTKDDFSLSVYSQQGRAFRLTELLGVQ
jgi:hypothetical protein